MRRYAVLLILILQQCYGEEVSRDRLESLRKRVKDVFYHAYDGYIEHAFPKDELQPLTCKGRDTWGSFSLTLIDALDTLLVLGNKTEFAKVAKYLVKELDFDYDKNVSVFESNIRVVGGLLSAHLLAGTHCPKILLSPEIIPPKWPCEGKLLDLAVIIAEKLLPAFRTATGMPYGTVNLRTGVPPNETPVTCTAGIGTFILEFGAISALTGRTEFANAANKAMEALHRHRDNNTNLLGNHINTQTGFWLAKESGIGGPIDSYFEYLVKGAILFQNSMWWDHYMIHKVSINKYYKTKDNMYKWVWMNSGKPAYHHYDALSAFLPGTETLYGDIDSAFKHVKKLAAIAIKHGGLPEHFDMTSKQPKSGRDGSPLRPELIESIMYLYRATRHPQLIDIGEALLLNIEVLHKTKCGYATQKSVKDHSLEDRMESFFLAETLKYFYLLFDPDNFLHDQDDQTFFQTGQVFHEGQCILDTGGYIFNTEAHPIDPAALNCCFQHNSKEKLEKDRNTRQDLTKILQSRFSNKFLHKPTKNVHLNSSTSSKTFNIFSETSSIYQNKWWDIVHESLPDF